MYSFVAGREDVWKEIRALAKTAYRKIAVISYFTDADLLSFKADDIVIVDASDRAIMFGNTSKKALHALCSSGADIYSVPDLHAKFALFDDTLVVGSMNASRHSAFDLIEAAIVVKNQDAVNDAREWVDKLLRRRALCKYVDDAFMSHADGVEVKVRPRGRSRGKKKASPRSMQTRGSNWWVIRAGGNLKPGNETERAEAWEEEIRERADPGVEGDVIYFRHTDRRPDLLKKGDWVIYGWNWNSRDRVAMPDCKVTDVRTFGNRKYVYLTYPKASLDKEITWAKFLKSAATHDLKIHRNATFKRLRADKALVLKEEWKGRNG